jgi:hypothetical protein
MSLLPQASKAHFSPSGNGARGDGDANGPSRLRTRRLSPSAPKNKAYLKGTKPSIALSAECVKTFFSGAKDRRNR